MFARLRRTRPEDAEQRAEIWQTADQVWPSSATVGHTLGPSLTNIGPNSDELQRTCSAVLRDFRRHYFCSYPGRSWEPRGRKLQEASVVHGGRVRTRSAQRPRYLAQKGAQGSDFTRAFVPAPCSIGEADVCWSQPLEPAGSRPSASASPRRSPGTHRAHYPRSSILEGSFRCRTRAAHTASRSKYD